MTGVIRDVERQEQRKFENRYILEQQMELTTKLREAEQKELDEKKAYSEQLNRLRDLQQKEFEQQNM